MDFRRMTKEFLLGEGSKRVSVHSHVQSLMDIISSMRITTKTAGRRAEMAKMHLNEIKRTVRRLEKNVQMLEEQLKILEEGKDND